MAERIRIFGALGNAHRADELKLKLYTYGSLVVRSFPMTNINLVYKHTPEEFITHAEKSFALAQRYGITNDAEVARDTVVDPDTHAEVPVVRVTCRKVDVCTAHTDDEVNKKNEKHVLLLEALYNYGCEVPQNLLLYDVSKNGGEPQYVYGKLHSDAEPTFILVDLDPYTARSKDDVVYFFAMLEDHIDDVLREPKLTTEQKQRLIQLAQKTRTKKREIHLRHV